MAVEPQVKELKAWAQTQPLVHADESPWLVKGVKEWLWNISGEGFSLFHAGDTRSRKELLITEAFANHRSYRETGQRSTYNQWVEDFKERVKGAIEKWRPKSGYSAGLLLKALRPYDF